MDTKLKFIFLIALITLSIDSNAQILGILKEKIKEKAVEKSTSLLGNNVKDMITSEAITTNFKDCNPSEIKPSTFGKNEKYNSLCQNNMTENGFELKPGYYKLNLKSFCIKAGTYAPSKGDGYLYAPLLGPKKEIIDRLVKNWAKHPEIEQKDVQALLWAIIAKASFKNLNPQLKYIATKLLTSKDLLSLSKMGLDFIPSQTMSELKNNLPQSVQLVLDAENKIRQSFNSSSYNYLELENLAMLAGFSTEKSTIEYGTWSKHPNGFWISYQPKGYSEMSISIYVPENFGNIYYIPSNDVAVPANTSSQRILLSDVKVCNN